MQTRYLESLDTNFFKSRPAPLVAADLQIQLLLGRQVSLSQTQAIDSGHLFHFLKHANGGDRKALLDFIEEDCIRIHLMEGVPSLRALVVKNLERKDFHFSAWHEFNGEQREMFLRECRQALVSGDGADLQTSSDRVNEQWSFLSRIDESLRERRLRMPDANAPERPKADAGLSAQLKMHAGAMVAQTTLRQKMNRMLLEYEGKSDSRTSYFRSIEDDHELNKEEKADLHSIVDGIYNRVVATSMGATANLTASSEAAAEGVATPKSLFGNVEMEPGRLKGMEWRTVYEVNREMLATSRTAKQRQAELEYLTEKISEQMGVHLVEDRLRVDISPHVPEFFNEGFKVGLEKGAEALGETVKEHMSNVVLGTSGLTTVFSYFKGHTPMAVPSVVIFVATILAKTIGSKVVPTLEDCVRFLHSNGIAARKEELVTILKQNPNYPHVKEPSGD